jgi:hypothetical protein
LRMAEQVGGGRVARSVGKGGRQHRTYVRIYPSGGAGDVSG